MTAPTCRVCGAPILYGGRGRIPSTCSPAHRLEARAEDARLRRAPATPAPPPVPTPALDSSETFRRIRARLATGGLTDTSEVRRLTLEERSALADLLNSESNSVTYAHDRLDGFARPSDFYSADPEDDAPTLGELGLTVVSAGRHGGTVWESDAAQHRLEEYTARDAARIREECVREAIRDAYADARFLGAHAPTAEALTLAREVGNKRADGILAALTA